MSSIICVEVIITYILIKITTTTSIGIIIATISIVCRSFVYTKLHVL